MMDDRTQRLGQHTAQTAPARAIQALGPAPPDPAARYRALRDHYQQQEQGFARAMADRQEWEQETARSRRLAIAADTELRRRHPYGKIEPLRSAEPAPVSGAEWQHPDLTPQQG